jgi:hypothetical protein
MMATTFKVLAVVVGLAAGTSSAAMAQYAVTAPGYPSNPVSGAAAGEMAGAANGAAEDGPVGAIVGGAIGTATGALAGTANALAGAPPACAPGYWYYNGACYPAR